MSTSTATVFRLHAAADSQGFPPASAWEITRPVLFDADWQGGNSDPLRLTEVRLLWTPETLHLRFRARYRSLTVFLDADSGGRRDLLWDRDVAEAFLQPDPSAARSYKEFEVSPNGYWVDLNISCGKKRNLQSGLTRRVSIDEKSKQWIAELSIPMKSLTARFDPRAIWRANFYRVEGPVEPRFYSAWCPTKTPQPNFHVPEAFGQLVFVESPAAHSQKRRAMTGPPFIRRHSPFRVLRSLVLLFMFLLTISVSAPLPASPPQGSSAPEVTKVEPPNWWIAIAPEVLLLLSGHGLEATRVSCNLPTVRVLRTQATAGGDYLFVWLKIGPSTRSGTAVCRITTPTEPTSFELPLAARAATYGKFQGLASRETPPAEEDDLRATRERLPQLKKQGMTILQLAPLTLRDADLDGMDHKVADFYSLDPRHGSLQDLQDIVASAHALQMKVGLDLELIRISSHHPWVVNPPLSEWLGAPPRNAGTLSQRSASLPRSGRILDAENPMVALYLLQNAIWWTETAGVDEIRVTPDPNTTSQFWAFWRGQLQRIYPHLAITLDSPHPQ